MVLKIYWDVTALKNISCKIKQTCVDWKSKSLLVFVADRFLLMQKTDKVLSRWQRLECVETFVNITQLIMEFH